jgi:hypothetical protein
METDAMARIETSRDIQIRPVALRQPRQQPPKISERRRLPVTSTIVNLMHNVLISIQ